MHTVLVHIQTRVHSLLQFQETENHLRRMQLRMREDERKMMEDNMVPYPDLTSGVVEGTGDRGVY